MGPDQQKKSLIQFKVKANRNYPCFSNSTIQPNLYNTDTSVLRTVRLVPEMSKIVHSLLLWYGHFCTSSETQGQIVGARESLNGRENKARRKVVKNGQKSPWGPCLTRPVPNGRRRSGLWLVPEKVCISGTNQTHTILVKGNNWTAPCSAGIGVS